ncbi:DMT family transporter [Ketobacter sp. MCCC 1A13808]|uniref:DMT family transporter n=1 Tax=Ketobacter sp. MCCC 1A13808 TaxID=2602738 RepID=UPI0012EB7F91|nr:DMT family transporter [Ketobacter sp. MCCC 1A13808]MVF14960.1 DMT family transporter [Ketobacter sp. MCCC 1A13808]
MNALFPILIALAVGTLLPIQAATNAAASRYFGDISYAALLSFIIGATTISGYVLIVRPTLNSPTLSSGFPGYIVLGGLISTVYTIAITYLAPRLGVGNTLFIIITGQMLAALLVDHLGIFGSIRQTLTLQRATGVALMIFGLYLTRKNS